MVCQHPSRKGDHLQVKINSSSNVGTGAVKIVCFLKKTLIEGFSTALKAHSRLKLCTKGSVLTGAGQSGHRLRFELSLNWRPLALEQLPR